MVQSGDKILTWHPTGKSGVYIARKDYTVITDFILSVLAPPARGDASREITLKDLIELGEVQLADKIVRDISWHILVVKLDLEARGLLTAFSKPIPHKSQFLKLKPGALKKYRNSVSGSSLLTQRSGLF